MNKLDMQSINIVDGNIEKISELFPNVIVESANGKAIDFELLKQELSKEIVDGVKEKYQLTWPGKKESIITGNKITTNTLIPEMKKSKNFNDTKNIYIEGDNLEVLKILQESYLNKIKCIYIDPPYNTGNDFIYNDDFSKSSNNELESSGQIDEFGNRLITNSSSNGRYHSDWLSMMYPRLKLARNLLSNDGIIFISIDNNELFNLKRLCDEVFGENSFVANIGIEITKTQGMKVKAAKEGSVVKNYEYILCYAKNNNSKKIVKNVLYDENPTYDTHFSIYLDKKSLAKKSIIDLFEQDERIKKEFEKYNLQIKMQNIDKLLNVSINFKNILYTEYADSIFQEMACNISIPKEVDDELANGNIVIYKDYILNKSSGNKLRQFSPLSETINTADDYSSTYGRVTIRGDLWKGFYSDMMNVAKEGNTDFPNGKKPVRLIKQLIKWVGLENDDIILDFFSGSATTAHAVMQYNSEFKKNVKYILVQIPEKISNEKTICDLGECRIINSGNKIKEETNANIDYGFRVYKVDSSNMKDVFYKPNDLEQSQLRLFESNIKEDRTTEDLLTQVILDLGLTLDLNIEERMIGNNKVYYVARNSLVACFDDNIDINIVDKICECEPYKVVFKDSAFKYDNDKINLEERFKKLLPQRASDEGFINIL
jgi:adenine-specific DNA-methyltransferase